MDKLSSKRPFPVILHALCAVLYTGTLITSSVELSYAFSFRNASCSIRGCWNFLTNVWILILPVVALSLAYLYWSLWLSRTDRSWDYRQILTIAGVLIFGMWLAVMVIGWAVIEQDTNYSTRPTAHFGDLTVDILVGSEIPTTGMFRWCVDFYNLVINPSGKITADMVAPHIGAARAGLAAVVFACLAFGLTVLDLIFTTWHSYGKHRGLQRGAIGTKAVSVSTAEQNV